MDLPDLAENEHLMKAVVRVVSLFASPAKVWGEWGREPGGGSLGKRRGTLGT